MIRIFGGVVALLGFCALAVCQTPELIDEDGIVFLRGAVVIDGTGAPPMPSSTVVLKNGRILRVGPDCQFRAGDRARVVNLDGRWILPGFIDVHVHAGVAVDEPSILTTLVAFGITTMRSVATADADLPFRERIARGEVLGPRLLTTGPLIDSLDSVFTGGIVSKVGSADEIRAEVRRQASRRVDFIKLLTGLTPDLVRAAIDEAHRANLWVIGHFGRTTWLQGAEAGIDELTHSAQAGMAVSLLPDSSYERFKESGDVGVAEGGQHLRVALEAGEPFGNVGEFIRQDFGGNLAGEVRIVGTVDFARAALTKFFRNAIMRERLP